ncbi:hypothetical protein WPS_26010 [Vulcanimicrobium alpinum]|uniref:HTH luxR-type domain-containing protein n=1 Tax=Vulcanimicrobium alpinum TaxID=3016050 RepID=A0AAN1XXQ4_UNVUL|nr:helix-turn-helix transcriptional regulator [Vulcanimicrobium alpinum]BDE07325.1 hypothetical protein WPS_26010 [Vulcanimicrobium alpinum]
MHDAPAVTLEHVYAVATRGSVAEIDELLAVYAAARRLKDAMPTGLRGMRASISGDVAGGIALLRRAVAHAADPERQYLIDMLVPLLISTADLDGADEALRATNDAVACLIPAALALRAVVAAQRGRDEQSRALAKRAVGDERALEMPIVAARILQRVALAALYRQEFEEAQERALAAARAYETIGAHRNAAVAYSVLYVIAHDWTCDPEITRLYAERMTISSERAGDVSMQNNGLVAQFGIAAEAGDDERLASIRARLLANPMSEQFGERFACVLAESLMHGWAGRFDVAEATIAAFAAADGRSLPEISLCESLLALFDAARWDVVAARRRAHLVLSRTAHHADPEPLYDAHSRRIARIIAASVCILVGESARGVRALTKRFDPDGAFAVLATQHHLDERAVPPIMRGYARLINVVRDAAVRNAPKLGLTRAEMDVLRALPDGATLEQIAAEFGKSRKTIARQVGAIYDKLEVSNRAQAVQRARDLGMYL